MVNGTPRRAVEMTRPCCELSSVAEILYGVILLLSRVGSGCVILSHSRWMYESGVLVCESDAVLEFEHCGHARPVRVWPSL